ncbi:mitochondrial metal transporter [Sorochytrium milnesiophthora]
MLTRTVLASRGYGHVGLRLLAPKVRRHGSHGHDHGDMAELLKANNRGSRITIIGILANIGLGAAKAIGGWYYHSPSLLADAGHNLSDLLSDAITLYTFRRSRRPASPRFPYGRGKIETIGTFTVSGLLLGGSALFSLNSLDALLAVVSPETAGYLSSWIGHHGHSHGGESLLRGEGHQLDYKALGLALGSWGVKETLFRATQRVGKELNSPVLIANAYHHRADGWASAVAVVGVGGSLMGVPIMDPLGGLVVSAMIARIGWGMGVSSLKELIDASLEPQALEKATTAANAAVNGTDVMSIESIIDVQVTPAANIALPAFLQATQDIRQHVRSALPQARDVNITIAELEAKTNEHQHEHGHHHHH